MTEHQTLQDIKTTIKAHRSNGQFADGACFIQNLSSEIRRRRSIAIEIIQLYLVQGQLRVAAEICDETSAPLFHDLDDDDLPPSIWEAEAAAFELLRAFVGIGRYSKLRTAMKIAQRVGSAWKLGGEHVENGDVKTMGAGEATIHHDALAADPQSAENKQTQRLNDDLTEYRVLLEFYYWKINVVAAEQGLVDENATKTSAAKHISILRKTLQSDSRLREARFLIYFEADMIRNAEDSLRELEHFADALNNPGWDVEKALTLVDIGERRLRSINKDVVASAEECFKEAEKLFEKTGHGFGQIDVDLARTSANNTISAGEKFVLKTKIADRYFEADHFQNGIRCLAFSIAPEMTIDLYADQVVKALELLQHKIEEAGSEILRQVSLIHSVCQASLKAPEYGFALQSLETYYANVPEEIGPKYHSYLASTLAMVYSTFGEHRKALQTAEESFQIASSGATYDVISDAAFRVGIHRHDVSKLYPESSPEVATWMISAMDILKEWADRDAMHGYIDGEVQKCLMIAGLENFRAIHHPEKVSGLIEQPWIDRVKQHISDSTSAPERDQIVDIETRMLMRQKKHSESLEVCTKHLNDLNNVSFVHPFTKAQAFLRSSTQTNLCAMNMLQAGESLPPETARSALQLLWSALDLATKALQLYRQTNGAEPVLDCTTLVWSLLSQLVVTMDELKAKQLLELFMDELHQTEKVCDQMRRSVMPISGLKPLMNKRLLVSKKASLKLYSIGVSLALQLNDPANAWEWLQKGKARAFTDSLGPNVLIPKELLANVSSDPTVRDLLKQEESILEALNEPRTNYVIAARQLVSVRKKIEENPLLAEVMGARDGALNFDLHTENLTAALEKTGLTPAMVKLVDWYIPPSNGQSDSHIILFVRQLDKLTITKTLLVRESEVKDWVKKAFEYPEMADPPLSKKTGNRFLQKMNVLLDGLSTLTQENDLLILSPSGVLNNVPLHALFIDGKPLVQRNLVAYSSSIATLRQCLSRMNPEAGLERGKSCASDTIKFFAVYEEPFCAQERNFIFSHIKELASDFPGTVSLGPDVTKPKFLSEVSTARWVHFHGHARYGKDDVLKSSLVLSNGKDLFTNNIDDARLGRDDLSVSELFNAKLMRDGAHFTVIACDSGTQDIAPGDEPLGLIPALFHAGATSILGCQWPIDSRAGRAFSEVFYQELSRGGLGDESCNNVVHLAKALQSDVRRINSGELGAHYKQAYFWAPFALHGLWFFQS
jgi:CHAT domain-containing protein